jgi:hypothetical protein
MMPLGVVAWGDSTDKKKADGTSIAAMGMEPRTNHFMSLERLASSTYRNATRASMSQTPACACPARHRSWRNGLSV